MSRDRSNRIDNPISSNIRGGLVKDLQSGISCVIDKEWRQVEIHFSHSSYRVIEWRNDRGHGYGFNVFDVHVSQLEKIAVLRKRIDASGRAIDLEVDGGIDRATAPRAIAAGADALVAGTATFEGGPERYAANIAALRGS